MIRKLDITPREWALFSLRWVYPVGLLMLTLTALAPDSEAPLWPLFLTAFLAIISNLVLALLYLSDFWNGMFPIFVIAADVGLAFAGVAVGGEVMAWAGLIPVITTGFYYDWIPATVVGTVTAIGVLILVFAVPRPEQASHIPALTVMLSSLIAAGPVIAFLKRDENTLTEVRDKERRAQQVSKLASEYMKVVYEMTSVLSIYRTNPRQVLVSAVEFGLSGLERVGVEPPLYGAVMLFDYSDSDELGSVLRMSFVTDNVLRSDETAAIPGQAGVIGTCLKTREPGISNSPAGDAELRLIESFRRSHCVMALPLQSGDESYGVILIGSEEKEAFRDIHLELMKALTNQATVALQNARLYDSLVKQRDRIVGIERSARAQLASELHDGPTQGIAAITMRLNYIRRLLEKKPEVAANELYQIEDLSRRTAKEIRQMLFELRPKALELGLAAGLEQLALKTKETYDQTVALKAQERIDDQLDSQTINTLFSIATECINNARKHAGAEVINVNLYTREDTLFLEIVDNGAGFEVDKALAAARSREGHLGLVNLLERAAVVEGTLHINSTPGKGTRIAVLIPLDIIRQRRQEEQSRAAEGGEDSHMAIVTGELV